MNDQDLFAVDKALRDPRTPINERDIAFTLAAEDHILQADRLAEQIMENIVTGHITPADAVAQVVNHEMFPRYRFHIDEAISDLACVGQRDQKALFEQAMTYRLEDIIQAASKALSGKLLSADEQLVGTMEEKS